MKIVKIITCAGIILAGSAAIALAKKSPIVQSPYQFL